MRSSRCVILRSYMSEFSTEKLRAMGLSALIAVIAFAASIAVAYLTCGTRHRIENFAVAFGNAGFIGIPLVTAVFGPEAAFYVVSFSTFANLLQWTYGIVIISGKKETMNLRMVFVNPVFISMVIGIALFVLQPTAPDGRYRYHRLHRGRQHRARHDHPRLLSLQGAAARSVR